MRPAVDPTSDQPDPSLCRHTDLSIRLPLPPTRQDRRRRIRLRPRRTSTHLGRHTGHYCSPLNAQKTLLQPLSFPSQTQPPLWPLCVKFFASDHAYHEFRCTASTHTSSLCPRRRLPSIHRTNYWLLLLRFVQVRKCARPAFGLLNTSPSASPIHHPPPS